MARTITFQGKPLMLAGNSPQVSGPAPAFTVTSQDMKDVTLDNFKGKIKLISTFPSLDTPVCDLQVKEFNKRASALSSDIAVIGISKDLPFAQKRFCSENSIKNETVLSDYKTSSFGSNYGLLIEGLYLLARAVLIIDKNDIVRYFQVVPELTTPPDYDGALKALEGVMKEPVLKK
jgi:thioredoxin-dependent peroxiredoxin